MPYLSNYKNAAKLARVYETLIYQTDIKIINYSLHIPLYKLETLYQAMPEKQGEIAHTLSRILPEILKKFTAIECFHDPLAMNFIALISVYKFASSIPFAELISVSEKIINPTNTQTENVIKKILVQNITELLTINFQSNGMTEELQQSALRMLEICKHSASHLCRSEQTDFFTRLRPASIAVANTTLSSFDNLLTTTHASISPALNDTMSAELTNTTTTSKPINTESRHFSPLLLGTRLGFESGLGLAQGLMLFANDRLFNSTIKFFDVLK